MNTGPTKTDAMHTGLTRRQQAVLDHLRRHAEESGYAPTLDELCAALGLRSRGSMHKHVQALIDAGLVEAMDGRQRGVRLTAAGGPDAADELPLMGRIAAGRPIEGIANPEMVQVPQWLRTDKPCYVLQVRGDSMIEEGILDGDWVVIESRDCARNGEIVVALVDASEVTLKRIEQRPDCILLHPANASMEPLRLRPDQVAIQGVLIAQMRRY